MFVLTHYAHDPIEMDGGTVFHFVTNGFDAAYAQAVGAAGKREVLIAGGASTVRQAFAAGVLDELVLDIGATRGRRGAVRRCRGSRARPVDVIHSPKATHVTYRIGAPGRRSRTASYPLWGRLQPARSRRRAT